MGKAENAEALLVISYILTQAPESECLWTLDTIL